MHPSSRETLLSIEREEFLILRVTETEKNDIFLQEKLRESFVPLFAALCFGTDQTKAKYDTIPKK